MIQEAYDNGNRQAFPDDFTQNGLSKREYFAAMALQGLITNGNFAYNDYSDAARKAVTAADTLLTELSKQP